MEWNNHIEEKVRQQLSSFREKDIRFFRVEEFLRMSTRTNEFAGTCRDCASFKHQIEKQVETIGDAISHPGCTRRDYDRLLGKLSSHMQKQHQFYPPFYFTYLLGAVYTVIASTAGFLISLLFPAISPWFFVIPGFILGLLVGQLRGAKKDSIVRKEKRLL